MVHKRKRTKNEIIKQKIFWKSAYIVNLSEILFETSQFPSKKRGKDKGGKIIAGGFWLIKFGHAVLSLATCLAESGNKNTFDIIFSQRVSLHWKYSIILFAANPHAKFDRGNLNAL